jgi:hypothetical protein
MNNITKVATLIVGVGMVTALVLPNRQTVPVIGAIKSLFDGALGTAISGRAA